MRVTIEGALDSSTYGMLKGKKMVYEITKMENNVLRKHKFVYVYIRWFQIVTAYITQQCVQSYTTVLRQQRVLLRSST